MSSGGFRPGELYGATFADLDLDGSIPLIKIIKALREKGESGRNEIGRTKTRDAVRTNPLHHLATRALRAWKSDGWARFVGRRPELADLVFPDERGAPRRPRDAQNLRRDLKVAGCPTKYGVEDITFKDATRHSFATWLGAAGIPDEIIGRLEGHSAKSVTRRHYIGDDLARLQEAIERIKLDLSTGQVVTLTLALATTHGGPKLASTFQE